MVTGHNPHPFGQADAVAVTATGDKKASFTNNSDDNLMWLTTVPSRHQQRTISSTSTGATTAKPRATACDWGPVACIKFCVMPVSEQKVLGQRMCGSTTHARTLYCSLHGKALHRHVQSTPQHPTDMSGLTCAQACQPATGSCRCNHNCRALQNSVTAVSHRQAQRTHTHQLTPGGW